MPKILIVDDSENSRLELSKLLTGAGMEVVAAAGGKAGLAAFQATKDFDLIVTDVNMPVMNGLAMIEEIRQSEAGREVPVIIVSADVDRDYKEQRKRLQIAAWVLKPVRPLVFIKGISDLLNVSAKPAATS